MAKKPSTNFWAFPAMVALLLVAVITIVQFILSKVFEGDLGKITDIVNIILRISAYIGYFFVALYAYEWAKAQRKKGWMIAYWICILIVVVFIVLNWL